MASTVFTIDDAIQAARQSFEDEAQRRIDDVEILTYHVPRALQQLYSDRPSLFVGHATLGAVNFKVAQMDPLPFDDNGFNDFVEAIIASVESKDEEAVAAGVAGMADAKSQRARKGG